MKTISLLTPADLKSAFTIEQASHAFPWSEKILLSNQGERYLNLKLEVNGELAGFAITQTVLDEATLFNIAIHPKFQRQGLGRELLATLVEQLKTKDIMMLWLEVRESNHNAIQLYHSIGFNETDIRCHYYPTKTGREDAIIMALII